MAGKELGLPGPYFGRQFTLAIIFVLYSRTIVIVIITKLEGAVEAVKFEMRKRGMMEGSSHRCIQQCGE